MERLQAHCQGLRHHTGRERQGSELQGLAYDDTPDKIMDKDDLLVGKRLQHRQIFQRVLLPIEPFTEQGYHIQQPDNQNGQSRQSISETINK